MMPQMPGFWNYPCRWFEERRRCYDVKLRLDAGWCGLESQKFWQLIISWTYLDALLLHVPSLFGVGNLRFPCILNCRVIIIFSILNAMYLLLWGRVLWLFCPILSLISKHFSFPVPVKVWAQRKQDFTKYKVPLKFFISLQLSECFQQFWREKTRKTEKFSTNLCG